MRRDYYAVLGIAATAGPREIRQAYRRLARQYSPDVNFWDNTTLALFEEIAEAYRVLSDPQARAMYDRFGAGPSMEMRQAGRRGGRACAACQGRGVRRAVEPVSVEIPAGVDSGTQVRVTGEGSAGPFG